MKTSKRNKLLGLALTGGFSLFCASNALAAAGDDILNRATLSYDVGTLPQTVIESSQGGNSTPGVGSGGDTLFKEDRIINFNVTREGTTVQVVPNATAQAIPYIVENTGNGTHGFLLAAVHNTGALDPFASGNSDIFDPTTIQTWLDVNQNGIYEPATDNVNFIASIAPGLANVERVFVVADIPADSRVPNPLVNGDVAVMTLVAQASIDGSTGVLGDAINADDNGNFSPGGTFSNGGAVVPAGTAATNPDNPATMETVFNDTATTDGVTGPTIDATGGNDIDQNAQQSAYSGYTIQSAELTVTKTSSALWDPLNQATSPKSIPGGYVRYTITIANAAGAADADLTTLSDTLAAALDLDLDFGDGTAANNPTSAVGDSFEITHVDNAVTNYCTGSTVDADGCGYVGGPGGVISVDINAVMGAINGQLTAGESLTISFNVIVQ